MHEIGYYVLLFFCFIALLTTIIGTIELLFLTTGALILTSKKQITSVTIPGTMVVVIPAHNEEKSIESTIVSVQKSDPQIPIVVIADNCSDQTAALAKILNVRVIERTDLQNIGKPFALKYAFNLLLKESYDCFLIIDADSIVKKNYIQETRLAFSNGSQAIQTRYDVMHPYSSIRHRLMNIAFLAFNYLRPLGRSKWGLSAGILGNGFGLTKKVLQDVPFNVTSVVEDLSYHLNLVRAGYKVDFLETTAVFGEIPASGKGVSTQRMRWEGGRFIEIRKQIPPLLKEMYRGNWRLLEPTMELLLLPLAYHVLILLFLLITTIPSLQIYAGISIAAVIYYLTAAICIGGGGWIDFAALFFAPFYIIWKLGFFIRLLPKMAKGMTWEKTDRPK